MSIPREAAMNALLTLLQTAATFRTAERRLIRWNEVTEFPALFLRDTGEIVGQRRGLPPKVTLKAEIWLYDNTGNDPHAVPSSALNNYFDAIFGALAPSTPLDKQLNAQTLGNLVSHCWIEGEPDKDPGDLDNIAKGVLDVRILLP